jgi:hypothetical protein
MRTNEIQALLKFGRGSSWPLRITVATAIDQETSLSITYKIGWEECDSSEAWAWTQFAAAAASDGLIQPPVFQSGEVRWDLRVRKENNAIRILMKEYAEDGSRPETPEAEIRPGPRLIMFFQE